MYGGHGQPLTVISVDILKAKAVNGQILFNADDHERDDYEK